MNGLVLHCGANQVEREQVYATPTPEPTDSHFPIPHSLLLEQVERNLADNGYEITQAAHALTKEGARYFGLIEVKRAVVAMLDDPSVVPDYNLVIGLRNAHDRSYCSAMAMGGRVFVCDNLSFSGEVLIGRKHTRNIARDIPLMVPRAFAALSVERVNLERRIEAYKGAGITDKDANDLVVRAIVDEKIFPARDLPQVIGEWRTPKHQEFQPRTVWSLFNAFTEIAKGGNLATTFQRTRGLHGFFDKGLGLQLMTRDQVLAEAGEDVVVGGEVHNRN